jgi:hypothetical protein
MKQLSSVLTYSLFLVFVAAFFMLFAPYGFNPTDDGVVLAAARRIAEGQIPHLNFISLRPAASAFIHLPELLIGGDFVFLVSRFIVVLQWAAMTIFSWLFFTTYLELKIKNLAQALLLCIGFMLMVHSFPIMAWTTIDALFFCSLGVYLMVLKKEWAATIGAVCLGIAVLCKQNFLPFPFIAIIVLGQYKSIRRWTCFLVPILIYIGWMLAAGAWPACKEQLLYRQAAILPLGVLAIYKLPLFIAGVAAAIGLVGLNHYKSKLPNFVLFIPIIMVSAFAVFTAFFLYHANSYRSTALLIWGCLLGLAIYETIIYTNVKLCAALWLVVGLAWCTLLSIGYNSPILAANWMWMLLFCYALIRFQPLINLTIVLGITFLIVTPLFYGLRTNTIYRQPAKKELRYHLGEVCYGFQGIYTDQQTYKCLRELAILSQKYPSGTFLLFDFAGFRATYNSSNALEGDWISQYELPAASMQKKLSETILSDRKHRFIFVQKYCSDVLANQLLPIEQLQDTFCLKLRQTIIDRSIKFDERQYFTVYRK